MSERTAQTLSEDRPHDDAARIRRLEDRIQVLSETMRAFAEATADLDELLDTVAHRVALVVGESCVLFIVSNDAAFLTPVSVHARDAELLAKIKAMYAAVPLRLAEHEALRRLIDTGEALMVPRLDLAVYGPMMSPEYVEHYRAVGAHSVLFVAVRAERRSIGLLALRRCSPAAPPFDEGDRDLAQTLADHAGLAITNSRLLRAARDAKAASARAEARFTRLSNAGIIGIVVANLKARILEINDVLLAMLGFSREEILSGAVLWKQLTPPEWDAVDRRAIEELTTHGVTRLREKEYFRKDGSRVSVLVGTAMLGEEEGESISFVLDLTGRKLSERARSQLAAIIDSSSDAIVAKSLNGTIESWNAGAERLFGYSQREAIGQPSAMLLPPDRRPEEQALLDRIAGGLAVPPFETVRVRCDGTTLHVSLAVSPIRNSEGTIVGVSTIARDISASKRTERLIRDSLGEKVVMLKEIHHRVKNNLQVVSSILRLHQKHVTDPAARAAFEASQGRVRSIALLHEQLYQSRDLASVEMATYARSLATALVRTHGEAIGHVSVDIDGGDVHLPIDLAAPCGLILNELLTNVFKHAFPGREASALVRIITRKDGDDLTLTVADNGVGLPPGFDISRSSSLGMYLIRTLAEQLGGTMEFVTDHGTRCTLRFSQRLEDD